MRDQSRPPKWTSPKPAATLFDGHFGVVRQQPYADRNVLIADVSHSRLLREPELFPLWESEGLFAFLRGSMPNFDDAIDKAVKNTLELEAGANANGSGQASVTLQRSWHNGWDVAAYVKAWWNGDRIVSRIQAEAGVGLPPYVFVVFSRWTPFTASSG
jgi:hypothetical protein